MQNTCTPMQNTVLRFLEYFSTTKSSETISLMCTSYGKIISVILSLTVAIPVGFDRFSYSMALKRLYGEQNVSDHFFFLAL